MGDLSAVIENLTAARRTAALALALALALAAGPALGAETAERSGTARKLLQSGREAALRGSFDEADVALRGALAACRSTGDEACQWTAIASLVAVAQAKGSRDEARSLALEALNAAHRMRDRAAQGESYHLLGVVLTESGEEKEARAAAERALAVGRELKRADLEARGLALLGLLKLAAGETEEACGDFSEALEKAQEAGGVQLELRARMGLGRCLQKQGNLDGAEAAYAEAFSKAVGLGDKLSVARLLHETGRLEAARQETARAEALLTDALRKYRSMGASAYAERAAADLERLKSEASLPTAAQRAERAAEAKRKGLERMEAGETEAAVRHLMEAAKLEPYDTETHRALAQAYRKMGLEALAEKEESYASGLAENSSSLELDSRNPRYIDYFASLRRQIDRVYFVPEEVLRGETSGTVRVTFTLERTGSLAEAAVETSSEAPLLDEAALRTLRLAEPFEPFPNGVAQERVTITARFVYEKSLSEDTPGPTK